MATVRVQFIDHKWRPSRSSLARESASLSEYAHVKKDAHVKRLDIIFLQQFILSRPLANYTETLLYILFFQERH